MKKAVVLSLASLFLLTGCGSSKNKVTCKGSMSESGIDATLKVVATLKDNKVSDVDMEYEFSSKDIASLMCSAAKATGAKVKCSGKSVKMSGDSAFEEAGLDKDMSKDDFIKAAKAQGLKC